MTCMKGVEHISEFDLPEDGPYVVGSLLIIILCGLCVLGLFPFCNIETYT